MNKLLTVLALGCMFVLTGCFTSSGPKYTVDMEANTVTLDNAIGTDKMAEAIATAAEKREWIVTKKEPGRIELYQDIRGKHEVTVAVSYTGNSFNVSYVSSKNLKYDPATRGIHGKYLNWVRVLKREIRAAAMK